MVFTVAALAEAVMPRRPAKQDGDRRRPMAAIRSDA
jgi:hypothetical protein